MICLSIIIFVKKTTRILIQRVRLNLGKSKIKKEITINFNKAKRFVNQILIFLKFIKIQLGLHVYQISLVPTFYSNNYFKRF